jgi:5-methylcytosine-specific restriction endonuclease McrA
MFRLFIYDRSCVVWPPVLKLDISGIPEAWVTVEESARYYATGSVAYTVGEPCALLRGGVSRLTMNRSQIEVHPIFAVNGQSAAHLLLSASPSLTRFNHKLFRRDKNICGYCGDSFSDQELEREHILPFSRGGRDSWMNVVSSCRPCNQRKANKTPEEANMPLLYAPYIPSRWEDLILQARQEHILGDQMEFLKAGLPPHSRVT